MAYTKEQIQDIFQSKFDVSIWTDFVINFFKAQTLMRVPEPLDIKPEEGTGYYWGKLSTSDTYEISFFYLKMNSAIDRRKVGLRQLIEKYIKIDSDAGIAVFDDGNHWRLSFITDMRGEKTSPKRFTFVFGDKSKYYKTAVSRFTELQRSGISYKNIKAAFSVEALTKQFYNDLFNWYTWALDSSSGVYFPNNPNTKEDDRDKLDTKLIRLITRLMFVWFIKQKKDENGKGLVPDNLFDTEELSLYLRDFNPLSMTSGNYYQAILQNLFFATLNRPIKNVTYDKEGNEIVERRCFATNKDKPDVKSKYRYTELFKISEDQILRLFEHIPFINGGLFECLDKNKTSDGVEQAYYDDGFSRNSTIRGGHYTKRAFIPNKLFFDPDDGIISIFNRYNFTVEENSPSEQQIALDPELLGKVFENLLGAYNPETHDQATDRKRSGSFYTPREIVNFMVDISLQSYLGNTEKVKALFKDDFEFDDTQKTFYDDVIKKLKSIKVLDPACGSGAFPMGMLNRIVDILQNLHAEGSKYDLKLAIMENCIFGGDIQTIAAQITKLRFFISLVCDCEKNSNADDNYGIPNLPNLETHFVTCDSLIALKKPQQYSLFEQDVIELKKKLQTIRHEHFMAKTVYQKTKLRNRDKELRDELAKILSDDDVIASEDAMQMVAWNPYDQNGKSTFFDSEWMFGIKDGFDIVIGNPPYIEAKKLKGKADKLKNYKVYSGSADYSIYFIEKGLNLCKSNGVVYYITTNKFFNTGYGEKLKKLILKKEIKHLINFEQVEVFENVLVSSVVLGVCNADAPKENNIPFKQYKKLKHEAFKEQFDGVLDTNDIYPQDLLDEKEWSFADTSHLLLKKKIESIIKEGKIVGKKPQLSTIPGIAIYRGVTTGYNPAFIIDNKKRDELIDKDKKNSAIIKNLLQGRNIRKWYYLESQENLLFIPWHFPLHEDSTIVGASIKSEKVFADKYPDIYSHLLDYKKELNERNQDETGIRYEWYALQRCAASYYNEFERPEKIIWGLTADKWAYTLDTEAHYLPSNGYILTSSKIPIRYVLGLLNSDLLKYYFTFIGVMTAGGAFTLKAATISSLPFCITENTAEIESIVNTILKKKSSNHDADVSCEEEQLNKIVYKLYNINQEEQELIRQKLETF